MTSAHDANRYQELAGRLRSRREELRDAVQAGLHAMGEENYAQEVGDLEDDALASWMQNLQVADLRHDVEEINDIDQALQRIRMGSYGACVDCGTEIPHARLRAYPTAKRCLSCQEFYERRLRR
jgi:DnaK suppressor protein